MATTEWNSIDDYDESFPAFNCAFLDILGYKQRVDSYFKGDFNLFGRINRALTTAATAMGLTAPLLNTHGLSVEVVSDSIIMTQPDTGNGLGAFLPFACQLSSTLSFEGLFVRGGISRGAHSRRQTDQGFDFLASEALIKAYLLESERAVNPRILVDQDIVPNLSREERDLLIDEQGDFFVDFAHHVINRAANNTGNVMAEMVELQQFMNAHPSEGVKAKYQWLLDYYCWTISENQNWNFDDFRHFASGDFNRFKRISS